MTTPAGGGRSTAPPAPTSVVTTLAGSGPTGREAGGLADGPGGSARFNNPGDVAVDGTGTLYVADAGNHRIRKITPAGVVTTLAGADSRGFADGPGASARFNGPTSITVDGANNLYVADADNYRIRKIMTTGNR